MEVEIFPAFSKGADVCTPIAKIATGDGDRGRSKYGSATDSSFISVNMAGIKALLLMGNTGIKLYQTIDDRKAKVEEVKAN